MFLKRLERRKSGKGHTYWALVGSIRTAKGSRHRVVAYLGELKRSEKNGWGQLCRRRGGQRPGGCCSEQGSAKSLKCSGWCSDCFTRRRVRASLRAPCGVSVGPGCRHAARSQRTSSAGRDHLVRAVGLADDNVTVLFAVSANIQVLICGMATSDCYISIEIAIIL